MTIRGGTVKVKRGIASIKVSCPGGRVRQLHRLARGAHRQGVKLAGLKVALQLGSARYNIAPGASKTLKVKLAKGSQRLADRKGRLKVRAIASTGPSGKIATSSQRLTLALGTATKQEVEQANRPHRGPQRPRPQPGAGPLACGSDRSGRADSNL